MAALDADAIGDDSEPFMTRNSLAALPVLVGMMLSGGAAAADVQNGASVFRKCRACHKVGPYAQNGVGPTQNAVVGRNAGTVEGFAYSKAMLAAAAKGLIWTEDNLDQYLASPRSFLPGTKMAFVGLRNPQDRKDIIAFLKTKK